jgi:DNA-binding response OmpR family regulator
LASSELVTRVPVARIGNPVTRVFREFSDFSQKVLNAGSGAPVLRFPSPQALTGMASPHVACEFGEFHLDRDERVLRRGTATVPLTPNATQILLALIGDRGQIAEKGGPHAAGLVGYQTVRRCSKRLVPPQTCEITITA